MYINKIVYHKTIYIYVCIYIKFVEYKTNLLPLQSLNLLQKPLECPLNVESSS